MSDITIRHVKKSFHHQVVLDVPSFDVKRGEIVAIVGANGAGKSTLIKTISGLMLQDTGSVLVYHHKNTSAAIHRDVKFVLESGRGYYEYLTANQNIDYFLHLNNLSRSQVKEELAELCQKLAFNPYTDRLVSELSQGTRQKLSLIIALLCQPKVLCLDEPTNGLDVVAKKQFATLLLELSQKKQTIILMTTHDIFFVKELSARICVMSKGKVKKQGSFSEIFGENNTWMKYRIGIPKFEKASFDQLFPFSAYQIEDERLVVEVTDSQTKHHIFEHFEIIFFEEVEKSIEELLYEVITDD